MRCERFKTWFGAYVSQDDINSKEGGKLARIARFKKARVVTGKDGKKSIVMPAKSEDDIQISIIKWAVLQKYKGRPLTYYLVHVPNGGYRKGREGAKLKRMGVQAGYPDLILDIPKGGYHGLRIELKKPKGSVTRDNQKQRIAALIDEGYYAEVCKGFQDTTQTIKRYMAGELLITNKQGEGCD